MVGEYCFDGEPNGRVIAFAFVIAVFEMSLKSMFFLQSLGSQLDRIQNERWLIHHLTLRHRCHLQGLCHGHISISFVSTYF